MLVFTDLDGTLLDQNYSWEPAAKVIENLKTAGVPLIFCSSKTRAEIEHYREAMGIKDPFISENGACTFIPDGYFDFEFPFTKESGGYKLIEAGKPYGEVLDKINEIKGVPGMGGITCFSDMTDEQLSTDARLPLKLARLAKEREYTEVFKYSGDANLLKKEAESRGLSVVFGGRYWNAGCGGDKGAATKTLIQLFSKKNGPVRSMGIGDSTSDLPMLMAVNTPVLMMRRDGTHEKADIAGLQRTHLWGPEGWSRKVLSMLVKELVTNSRRDEEVL